jgi:hypothetical protein
MRKSSANHVESRGTTIGQYAPLFHRHGFAGLAMGITAWFFSSFYKFSALVFTHVVHDNNRLGFEILHGLHRTNSMNNKGYLV